MSPDAYGQAPATAINGEKRLSSYAGWNWYTIDEPKPRISVFEAAGDGLVIKHGYVSMFNLGGKWFDTVQEIKRVGSDKLESTYRYTDGRPTLKTIWTARSDGTFLEEFRDVAGTSFRNLISFNGSVQQIERMKLNGADWTRINISKKDGWSPKRQEEARLAAEQQLRAFQQQMAREAQRLREEEAYWAEVEAEERAQEQARQRALAQSTPNAYDILTGMANKAKADADRARAQLYDTIARGQQQNKAEQSPQTNNDVSAGNRLVQQEQARAEQLRREREARVAEEQRLAQQEAAARRQREEDARRRAEAERNRPVDWAEGVVLCEPRQNSQEWRCTGPLQMNILKLDTPNTYAQLGLACGSSNGIREIGPVGSYRAFGCGFGIHPTATNYPGNRDVPKEFGVFVSDRRVFRCPTSKDAYCRSQ